ncbi:MAG: tyrosine-type recombinase/integrase [Bacilli bacterium]|nr:tyrosine-type recombinase/integrase [Bacilli bacterium]
MDKEEFKKNYLIDAFIKYIESKNYSINTLNSYINDLFYFYLFVKKDLDKVIYEDVSDYLEYLKLNGNKKKNTSIKRMISSLKSFYKFLYRNNYIKKENNPMVRVSAPKIEKRLPHFLYYNDLLEIIRESSKDKDGIRDQLIIEMLYATGVRVSELVNIKIKDIYFDNRRIIVQGKGNKERIVYYGEYAEEVLKEYMNTHYRKDYEYLFVNSKGEKITDAGIRYIIDKIMEKLSIKVHVTPHVLRHTFATDMLNNGCDIKVVQELLGHSSLKATEIYTHVTNERLKEVYYNCFPRRDKDE